MSGKWISHFQPPALGDRMFVSEITQLGFCYNSPGKVNLRVTTGLILSLLSVFSAETDDNPGKGNSRILTGLPVL